MKSRVKGRTQAGVVGGRLPFIVRTIENQQNKSASTKFPQYIRPNIQVLANDAFLIPQEKSLVDSDIYGV